MEFCSSENQIFLGLHCTYFAQTTRCGGFTKKILTKIILLPCNLQKKLHCGSRYLDVYTRSYLVFVKGKKSIVANLQLSFGYTLPIAFYVRFITRKFKISIFWVPEKIVLVQSVQYYNLEKTDQFLFTVTGLYMIAALDYNSLMIT